MKSHKRQPPKPGRAWRIRVSDGDMFVIVTVWAVTKPDARELAKEVFAP